VYSNFAYRNEEPQQYAEDNTDANWLQDITIEEDDADANWLQAIQIDEDDEPVNTIVTNTIRSLHHDIIGPDGTIWEIKYTLSA
jgi:hypothetical protein